MVVYEKLLMVFVGDVMFDVVQVGNIWLFEMQVFGVLELLESWFVCMLVFIVSDYFDGIWVINVLGGQCVGLLWYVDIWLMFVCQDFFVQVGIWQMLQDWDVWCVMFVCLC